MIKINLNLQANYSEDQLAGKHFFWLFILLFCSFWLFFNFIFIISHVKFFSCEVTKDVHVYAKQKMYNKNNNILPAFNLHTICS